MAAARAARALVTGTRRIGGAIARALAGRGYDVALAYRASRGGRGGRGRRGPRRRAPRRGPRRPISPSPPPAARWWRRRRGRWAACRPRAARLALRPHRLRRAWTSTPGMRALAVDLDASFFCAQAAVPHLRGAGGGHIVLFATGWPPAAVPAIAASCRTTSPSAASSPSARRWRSSSPATASASTSSRPARSCRSPAHAADEACRPGRHAAGHWGGERRGRPPRRCSCRRDLRHRRDHPRRRRPPPRLTATVGPGAIPPVEFCYLNRLPLWLCGHLCSESLQLGSLRPTVGIGLPTRIQRSSLHAADCRRPFQAHGHPSPASAARCRRRRHGQELSAPPRGHAGGQERRLLGAAAR